MNVTPDSYRQILESLPDGLYMLDRQLVVRYTNPGIERLLQSLGVCSDLVGKRFTDVFPDTLTYLQDEIETVFDSKTPLCARHTVTVAGRCVTYETVRIPMFDSDGSVATVLNSIHDITNHLAAQKSLAETRRLFEIMVDNANSIILRMSLDGRITYFNHFAETFFGFARDEIIGRTVQETIIPPIDTEQHDLSRLIEQIVRDPSAFALNENENVRKDGTRVWVSWSNKPVTDDNGNAIEILCVGNDITALKNAQRELVSYRDHLEELVKRRTEELTRSERLASLGTLVSGVAHEINNPNNFIILNSDNLADIWKEIEPILDERFRDNPGLRIVGLPYAELRGEMDHLIGGLREGARRIRAIVGHLKDFARQGPVDMDRDVDMGAVIEAAQIITANAIKNATSKFSVTVTPGLPAVRGDFQKLEQVIINLLTNACQALTSRGQAVEISASECRPGAVCVTVRDEGVGIAAEDIPRIFDPFYTTRRDSGGTGLGLSISYGIVKDHGGTMEVQSELGVGTTFTVILPASHS